MEDQDLFKLSPEAFEEFCLRFLKKTGFKFKNVTPFGSKGSDKGRDIVADLDTEYFPGRYMTQKWIIQCKRVKQLTQSDVSKEVSKVVQNEFDHYLIMTTAEVSADLRDALNSIAKRFNLRTINVIDGLELRTTVEVKFPELSIELGATSKADTELQTINRLFSRNRVVTSGVNPHLDRFLSQYLERGYIAKIKMLSQTGKKVFVNAGDGVFHAVTSGLAKTKDIRKACGGYMLESVIESNRELANTTIKGIREVRAISLDWSDTLVNEIDLDEHICESLARVEGEKDESIDQYYRFNRILHSLHSRADQKWFDYSYLASLVGKTKEDVLAAHDNFHGTWGFLDGAERFLDFLKKLRKEKKIKIGIVTHCYRDFLKKRAQLLKLDLKMFDFCVTGEDASDMTDKEPLIVKALKDSKTEAIDFLHIGDHVARDILAATRLQCKALLVRFIARDTQTFWTSAQSPFSGDLLELKSAQNRSSDIGFVTSYDQITRILK